MDDIAFSTEALARLPLADAVWRLLHFTMADDWLDDVWERERGRCYEKILDFPSLAHLVVDALLEHDGSGCQGFERGREDGMMAVSNGWTFDNLGNLPLPLCEALVVVGNRRLHEILLTGITTCDLPAAAFTYQ